MLHSEMYSVQAGQFVTITSPLGYSPDNPSQACLSLTFNDQYDCTAYI